MKKSLQRGLLSHHGVKKYQPLHQKLVLNMVRLTGLEPVPSRTRPSNVRVCLFRHNRKHKTYYTRGKVNCQ